MNISLIINTYNRPDALAALLRSVARQTLLPNEVIIGDDGSGQETRDLIRATTIPHVPIHHAWLPDDGFRAARARNSAIARAKGDYLVFVDGDMLLHNRFIEDHARAARPGLCLHAPRVYLDEKLTSLALTKQTFWPSYFAPGLQCRRNTIRSECLAWFKQKLKKPFRSNNFSLWRDDVVRINGFNENFVGWGHEDTEFAIRLSNAGITFKKLRYLALCCHLHHPYQSRDSEPGNMKLLEQTIEKKLVRCLNGLDTHEQLPL